MPCFVEIDRNMIALPPPTDVLMQQPAAAMKNQKEDRMLWTIAVILIVLWLLGLITSYTMGGFIGETRVVEAVPLSH